MINKQEAKILAKIIRPYPIRYLYKYRSMQSRGLRDMFEKRQVFLSDATQFNDPFESEPQIIVDESSLKRKAFLKEVTKNHFPTANKAERKKLMRGKLRLLTNKEELIKTYNNFVSKIGIYSLSEKNDDLLMWAHYSDAHRGLCLEFEAFTEGSLFWEAFSVTYQEDYPIVNIMRIDKADEFRKALLTKSTHWAYELERRVLKMENEGGPGVYNFPPETLTGVIFGARISDDDKETVKRWVKAYPSKIAIYQAALNGRKYQLDINKIA